MSTSITDKRAALTEVIKRFGDSSEVSKVEPITRTFNFSKDLFDKQLGLINDESKLKAALCGRRAGKTYSVCYYLIQEAYRLPDSICAYVALTRPSAKRLMWQEMKRANRRYNLGLRFNNAELVVTCPNNSQIFLAGANDEGDIDKLRGSAYRLVVLDECASFGPHIESLVEEVLEPALIDHDGTMVLIGTPNAACSGLFHYATTNPNSGYSVHHWTVLDNPHVPDAKEWLKRRMQRKGWGEDHPIYLREWCGRWVQSYDSLVYPFAEDKNIYTEPPSDVNFVLGVDLGYEDATAFVIGAYSSDSPAFYIVDCKKESHLIPAEIAEEIRFYISRYNPSSIVMDTGGLGKSIAEEMKKRHGLPIRYAEKRNKAAYIELMGSDMRLGHVKVAPNSPIIDEWKLLQWDEDKRKEDGRYENHLCDAALYAWRESRHYLHKSVMPSMEVGSDEYWKAQEEKMWNQVASKLEDSSEAWWENRWELN